MGLIPSSSIQLDWKKKDHLYYGLCPHTDPQGMPLYHLTTQALHSFGNTNQFAKQDQLLVIH